jgi:hypothetical protein
MTVAKKKMFGRGDVVKVVPRGEDRKPFYGFFRGEQTQNRRRKMVVETCKGAILIYDISLVEPLEG